ncbi:glycosyltransferase [Candidatus Microgenomates bacterium]|nr:glycosyltransferase [Candidatus Microgenomates bacterium]
MTASVTIHSLVRNEECWVWFALKPWQRAGVPMLVIDDHSTDQTPQIISSLKIPFQASQGPSVSEIRNKMLSQTTTEWFILLDGDEVWNDAMIDKFLSHLKSVPKNIIGIFLETRNCVGDVWHYLPSDSGRYRLAGHVGHLNIRAYRKKPGYQWFGQYPLEYYGQKDQPINADPNQLSCFPGFYWHLTHLPRTSRPGTAGFRRQVIESGIEVPRSELPEVFFLPRPDFVPNPLTRRSPLFTLTAKIVTPIKKLKRLL